MTVALSTREHNKSADPLGSQACASSLFPSLSSLNSLSLPQSPSWWAQEAPGGVVRVQRVSHKPHDAPSLAQQSLLANPPKRAGLQKAARPSLEAFCEARSMLGQTDLLQNTYADLLFLTRGARPSLCYICIINLGAAVRSQQKVLIRRGIWPRGHLRKTPGGAPGGVLQAVPGARF